jgi:hypothetical protein
MKVHRAESDTRWRSQRFSLTDFLARQIRKGCVINPIFAVFGIALLIFRIDWLHAVDLGVGADFLGNLLWMIAEKMPAPNQESRCILLWKEITHYYDTYSVKDRMKKFSINSIRPSASTPPKLHCSASCCRALIYFGHLAAQRFLSDDVPTELAAKTAAYHLNVCYSTLKTLKVSSALKSDALFRSSQAFILQYAGLMSVSDGIAWRIKPKAHMFLELCAEDSQPNLFWTYRDEDYGGTVAKTCKMRGSWKKASCFAAHALDLFHIDNEFPRIV